MTEHNQGHRDTVAAMLRNLSHQDFKDFGTELMAYVKPVQKDGRAVYALYAADGKLLGVQDSASLAVAMGRHNGLEPVSVQ
ncbi:MAG: DUF1150 domain-containing protein [Rhodospirillales bacterium]|nr:DUF1150 domain-containing protein [Rhodospirillales bacterium]MCB9996108.1 DUF1150 domain-containing protein [Rhodospirillales bacterium]